MMVVGDVRMNDGSQSRKGSRLSLTVQVGGIAMFFLIHTYFHYITNNHHLIPIYFLLVGAKIITADEGPRPKHPVFL